jgi:hypothetical protein
LCCCTIHHFLLFSDFPGKTYRHLWFPYFQTLENQIPILMSFVLWTDNLSYPGGQEPLHTIPMETCCCLCSRLIFLYFLGLPLVLRFGFKLGKTWALELNLFYLSLLSFFPLQSFQIFRDEVFLFSPNSIWRFCYINSVIKSTKTSLMCYNGR